MGWEYLDRHKRWCPIPSITDSFASSPVRRNKQWKSVFGFKGTKIFFNYSSTVGCIFMSPLEWTNTFPMSFLRIHAPAVFPVTKCWQSFCSARGSSDSKADVRAVLMKLLISWSQNFTQPPKSPAFCLQCFPLLPKAVLDVLSLQMLVLCLAQ